MHMRTFTLYIYDTYLREYLIVRNPITARARDGETRARLGMQNARANYNARGAGSTTARGLINIVYSYSSSREAWSYITVERTE